MLTRARRAFYNAGGPYRRARLAERLGSRRWSRPALHDLDQRLEALIDKDGGVFVEAGAHDGFTQSNTYYLERFRGWHGLLAEPVPELCAKARARRSHARVVQCALVAPAQSGGSVQVAFGDLMSVVGDENAHARAGLEVAGRSGYGVEVPARTLNEVLDEAAIGAVDLMVLDLEGGELDALRGLDLERHPVRWLLVEMLELERQRPAFDQLLAGRMRFFEAPTHADALYTAV